MAYIACFDSGLGGVSTLAALQRQLPQEDLLYYADTLHTPYGGRARKEVLALTRAAVAELLPQGLKALVIACNTATSAAVSELRAELDMPVLGLEPAVKPALEQCAGRVLVLGTELTVREQKFIQLLKRLPRAQRVTALACPGLVELIERSPAEPALTAYLEELLQPYLPETEALVLGCTHYVFLRPLLQSRWPQLHVFDGNQGLSRHLAAILAQRNALGGSARLRWLCSEPGASAQKAFAAKAQTYLDFCQQHQI